MNYKKRLHIKYPDVSSVTKPIPHGPDILLPEPDFRADLFTDASCTEALTTEESDTYDPCKNAEPMPLPQKALNDLTRDLNLSKESAQLIGLCLREKNFLDPCKTFYYSTETVKQNYGYLSRLMRYSN